KQKSLPEETANQGVGPYLYPRSRVQIDIGVDAPKFSPHIPECRGIAAKQSQKLKDTAHRGLFQSSSAKALKHSKTSVTLRARLLIHRGQHRDVAGRGAGKDVGQQKELYFRPSKRDSTLGVVQPIA